MAKPYRMCLWPSNSPLMPHRGNAAAFTLMLRPRIRRLGAVAIFGGGVVLGHLRQTDDGNFGGVAGLSELPHALLADFLHGGARRSQVVARIEFLGLVG